MSSPGRDQETLLQEDDSSYISERGFNEIKKCVYFIKISQYTFFVQFYHIPKEHILFKMKPVLMDVPFLMEKQLENSNFLSSCDVSLQLDFFLFKQKCVEHPGN